MGLPLIVCGMLAAAVGVWRGFVVAREALGPLLHDGEPTRALIDAGRPVLERARVRLFIRRTLVAIGWLTVAMYGLLLLSIGAGTR